MPTQVEVKVTSKGQVVRGEFNMIEIKGYDHTNNKNFTKAFFETKRDGSLTKNAEIANTLVQNDWITITLDDTSYHNVQSIRKTGEPVGGAAAAAAAPAPAAGGGTRANSSDKMSKAEWAEKDRKKAVSVARSVAVKAAAQMCSGTAAAPSKKLVDTLEKLAYRMEAYLMKGAFDAELDPDEPVAPPAPAVVTPAPQVDAAASATDGGPVPTDQSVAGVDDDIPF